MCIRDRTATVTISAPEALIEEVASCSLLYFPVPTKSLDEKLFPAMTRLSAVN